MGETHLPTTADYANAAAQNANDRARQLEARVAALERAVEALGGYAHVHGEP